MIGIGGALGALCRSWLGNSITQRAGGAFPWATLSINVSGCFLLGLLMGVLSRSVPAWQQPLQLALGVGFLGAYTTFSTFELEILTLMRCGAWLVAAGYILCSLVLGLVAVWIGLSAGG